MKKAIVLLLAALMLLATLSVAVTAAADPDASKLPTPTFSYDFSKGLNEEIVDEGNRIMVSYTNAEGYVTFTSEGDDPYFRFTDAHAPTVTTENLAYAVMKYRTTASVGKGEFFTNRTNGPQWGQDGSHVDWKYNNDGNWHAVVIDNTGAWGNVTGESLYAFRLDPLATPAKKGDTIDIAYIHFFATKEDAEAYAYGEFPDDKPVETQPASTYTIRFNVDGNTVYTLTYKAGDKSIDEPVVPARPGYTGKWEAYELADKDLVVNAVYTPDGTADATDTEVPDVPSMPTESTSETEAGSAIDGTTAAEATAEATAAETEAKASGCGATLAVSILALLAPVACVLFRKKED